MPPNPLSRRIPALLIRMVTPPKVSSAVLITVGPSVTEELFTTALPTPPTSVISGCQHVGFVWSTSRKGAINAHLR
jgi:hypothetical protein